MYWYSISNWLMKFGPNQSVFIFIQKVALFHWLCRSICSWTDRKFLSSLNSLSQFCCKNYDCFSIVDLPNNGTVQQQTNKGVMEHMDQIKKADKSVIARTDDLGVNTTKIPVVTTTVNRYIKIEQDRPVDSWSIISLELVWDLLYMKISSITHILNQS